MEMAAVASAEHEGGGSETTAGGWLRSVRTPLLIAAVGTLLTLLAGLVTQHLTQSSQNNAKRLELKTTLATDMSRSYTAAVGVARSVATGTVSSPTGRPVKGDEFAAAYNRALDKW